MKAWSTAKRWTSSLLDALAGKPDGWTYYRIASAERDALVEALDRIGYDVLHGDFVRPDGTTSTVFLQRRPQTVAEMAEEQGVVQITDLDAMVDHDATEEEIDAFYEALGGFGDPQTE